MVDQIGWLWAGGGGGLTGGWERREDKRIKLEVGLKVMGIFRLTIDQLGPLFGYVGDRKIESWQLSSNCNYLINLGCLVLITVVNLTRSAINL